jgi:phosphatidylglycerophosphate synthase
MFDKQALAVTKPAVDAIARSLHRHGITPNQITVFGFVCGIIAALVIAAGFAATAIVPLLINRICDGIDGALARLGQPSDRGAFLDITLDFLFYAAVPLAFAFCNPQQNALAAATVLASFIATGVSFLAYAIMAEKRGERATNYPTKAFYYLGGLTEGTETIACFVLMCITPQWFATIAYVYAALCAITAATRIASGWRQFQ